MERRRGFHCRVDASQADVPGMSPAGQSSDSVGGLVSSCFVWLTADLDQTELHLAWASAYTEIRVSPTDL